MKNKGLLITAVVFFFVINTVYYWEGKLGFFAFPVDTILLVTYVVLVILLLKQIYIVIKEKLTDKPRILLVVILIIILLLTFLRPFGLINFDNLEGDNLLIAEREGVANCMTTLKLKEDLTFRKKTVCFGVDEITGNYYIQNDTIYFHDVSKGRNKDEFYRFAVVKLSKFGKHGQANTLIQYRNLADTIGNELGIIKNELYKLKDIKPNR